MSLFSQVQGDHTLAFEAIERSGNLDNNMKI